jgi:hypothetical protein
MAGGYCIEASFENPDVAIAMDMHPDDFSPVASIHRLGNRRPAFGEPVRIGELRWFGVMGLLGVRYGTKGGDRGYASYKNKTCSNGM